MDRRFERTELLFGAEAMEKLKNKRVLVVGTGGVGGFAVEAIARCGVGNIDLLDFDTVDITNINRPRKHSGQKKGGGVRRACKTD